MRRASPGRRSGFTLLEVIAAVLVVGMTFSLLARANIEALRSEGISARRLEASLLADRTVAELEALLANGTAPQVGRQESEVEGFQVRVETAPLELTLDPLPPEVAESVSLGDRDRPNSLLTRPGRGNVTPIRHVHVDVAWDDGTGEEDSVVRDTFVFDGASVASLLAPLAEEALPRVRDADEREEDDPTRLVPDEEPEA